LSATTDLVKKLIPQSLMALSAVVASVWSATPAQAFQLFFGEDPGLGSFTRPSSRPNADDARAQFLSKLVDVQIEDLESFPDGTTSPLNLSFIGSGSSTVSATLQGGGFINTLPGDSTDGFGRYPISGDTYWDSGSNFSLTFSHPVAAFGFYGVDIRDVGGILTLTVADGTTTTLTVPSAVTRLDGSVLFYGIIAENSSQLFTKVTFGNSTATKPNIDRFGFDDFTIGRPKPPNPPIPREVPEPTSGLGILGLGALGVGWRKMRQIRRQVP
jgi:PEP-CTERM motif